MADTTPVETTEATPVATEPVATPVENSGQENSNTDTTPIVTPDETQDADFNSFWEDILGDKKETPSTPEDKEVATVSDNSQAFQELQAKYDESKKFVDVINADPMLKKFVEQVVGGKSVTLSESLKAFIASRASGMSTTEGLSPQGSSPRAKTLQEQLVAITSQSPENNLRKV